MSTNNLVFLGIKGSVVALDKATGRRVWETKLKGSDYVSLLVEGDRVLAGAQGEIFCLEATSGKIWWHDSLKGYGFGLMCIATQNGRSDASSAQAQKARQQQAAGASGGAVAGVS